MAIAPIHATGVSGAGSSIVDSVVVAGDDVEPEHLAADVVVVTDGPVRIDPPTLASGRRVATDAVSSDGAWEPETDGWAAIGGIGSELAVRSWSKSIVMPFRTVPGGGTVAVRTGNQALDVSLDGPDGIRFVTVVSEARRVVATQRFLFEKKTFDLPAGTKRIETWTGITPVSHTIDRNAAASSVEVPPTAVLSALRHEFVQILPLLLVAVVMAVASLLIGWCVLVLLGGPGTRAANSFAVTFVVGLSLPVTTLGMLHYVLSVRLALVIVAALLVALVIATVRRLRTTPATWRFPRYSFDAPVITVVVIALIFTVMPALLTRRMNVGHLNTDIYDYFHLTRVFWDESVLSAGTDWGDGLRVIDSSWRAAIQGLTGLTAGEATLALRFLLVGAMPLAVSEAAGALGAGIARRTIAASLAAASSPLLALWVEGYLSRELFATLSILVLAAAVVLLVAEASSSADEGTAREAAPRTWGGIGVAAALPAAIVPPYSTVVVAIAATLVLRNLRVRSAKGLRTLAHAVGRARALWWFVGGIAAAGLVNMVWVRSPDVANSYAQGVNPIGLNLVVPFHDTGRYPATLLGFVPFHTNREAVLGAEVGTWVPRPVPDLLDLADRVFAGHVWIGLSWLAFAVIAFLAARHAWVSHRLRSAVLLLAATAGITLLGFVVSLTRWQSQSFFVLMWGWTLAPILVVALGLLVIGPRTSSRVLATVSVTALVIIVAANATTSVAEASRWLDHPYASWSERSHFDLAPDLAALRDRAEELTRGHERFRIELPPSDIAGTDDDRVAINEIELILVANGLNCENCIEDTRNGAVLYVEDPPSTLPDLTVVVGENTCGPDDARVFRGRQFAVCERVAPSAGR